MVSFFILSAALLQEVFTCPIKKWVGHGNPTDRRRFVFLAHRSAPGRLAHRARFLGDHSSTPSSVIRYTIMFGLLWGIGGLTYGLGVRYLACHLGIPWFLDSALPLEPWSRPFIIIYPYPGKTSFHDLLTTSWGIIVLAGVITCLLGIYVCGRAGVMKEKELPESEKKKLLKNLTSPRG